MMDGTAIVSDDHFDPPSRLFERLRQIAGYTWDESRLPFHTSYDIWHVCGTRFVSPYQPSSSSHPASSPGSTARLQSGRPSPSEHASSTSLHSGLPSDASSDFSATSPPASQATGAEISYIEEPVVARVSYHVLREERAFHIAKNLFATADPNGHHIVKPLDLIRLAPHPGDRGSIVVAIYQHPGQNYLFDLIDLGPAFYKARKVDDRYEAYRRDKLHLKEPINLQEFLDFAIGASQCLEILHYGQVITHGEIRPDSFHFNIDTNSVKLINFGTGTRSFEGGLSSTSWSSLSKELGAKNKLLYISPEQTGRMPAEPDSRTDIYSLGVVFWTLLTQQPVFEGDTPLDIVQGVLGRRIPNVSQVRLDIPDVIGRIIQKCTAKNVADRYHSASGLKHDLLKVQQFLTDGDWLALKEWKIGEKDISSFFILPIRTTRVADPPQELITQIIGARMKMVVIITYRPEELSPERVQSIIQPPESEEFPRSGGPVVTRIRLNPLGEEEIIQYVSTTLCRPKEEVMPLAIVIQSKTAGNPFYMREMLSACYRKRCIWYDYRDSNWHFDLDRLFEHFQGESDYDILDTGFITRRLNELPPSSRAILAWAALLGSSFSFELITRLLSGEFQYEDETTCRGPGNERYHASYSQQEAVNGLQAAVQAYIIVPSETDDRFRFAHDRFIQASAALKECNARKMHFVIAQTLLKYYSADPRAKDNTASHICESVDIIKKRVPRREPYRKLLFDCAQAAVENCARPTASKFYSTAVALLQPDPWNDELEDVSYDETMQLHLRAAECYLYMGNHGAANALLETVFRCARSPLDKAPAYVLQSRTLAQIGNAKGALASLRECLRALDVEFDDDPTFEKCDDQFEKMSVRIQTMDKTELMNPTPSLDPGLPSIGAVLAETVSAAWWSDYLRFYQLSLVMLELHLTHGAFPQSGMAFLHLGIIALARFNMVSFAVEVGNVCIELLGRYRDPFSMARGYMLYANFIGHVQIPVAVALNHLEGSVEYAAAAGDRISSILSFGLAAQLKFFSSENCSDLEAFCQYGCEEIPNWHQDTRGGTLLISIRQACRALQGKTRTTEPLDVMTDDQHNSATYKAWLRTNTQNGNRSILWYESIEIVPLFIYGHYDRAIEVGQACYESVQNLWSARNSRLVIFFYGLALAGRMLRRLNDPRLDPNDLIEETEDTVYKLRELTKRIKEWEVYTDVNYLSWSRILEAQIDELTCDYGGAVKLYEESLDNAEEHNYLFEAALGNTLMAGTLVRRKARRLARSAFRDAIAFYRQFGAVAVAERLEEEHAILLHSPTRNPRTTDAAVQTDFAGDSSGVDYRAVDGEENQDALQHANQTAIADIKGERIGAWRGSMHEHNEPGAGLPALDMIDLHAILLSSQVISGVLRVDELLKTMCDVILQTCGGSATLAAIVVQDSDESGWCLAASGDPERGASAHIPGLPLAGTSLVAENVILYCTRFREAVFIPDIISDERFGNVSEAWLQRNVLSKAIIAIPICHGSKPLLGVLYLEGEPGSFTDRNVSVLQLLVNQIGISYSNALAMKAVEKVSAENVSMVSLQKRALAKALEAETKAKHAEAEAKRNVKLAEEAAKAKSIFLANVSHELRTPLNGVIGNSELLRDSNLDKDQQEMADSIRVSADLLLTVINDILDFSRMEADKMKLYVIAFNPEEMVREVVRAVSYSNRQKTQRRNVKIIQDINLPSMLIYGDPIRLHQVLGNLIGNSLKFTEDGSITIGARVDSETKDKATLTFRVQDTGIGIPQQQLAKLFQPFSQADNSTARKYGGSGLGLSICKSLIETMMKGKIQLESQENVGTTAWFTVTFDKAKSDVSAGDAQQIKSPPPVERSALPVSERRMTSPNPFLDLTAIPKEQIRICIAEDNPINQKIAIQYAQRLGYTTVDAFENGLKAVEGLRQKAREGRPYHVVLMDVQMPVLDGYEATKMIRKDSIDVVRKVLVIAMTASAIQGDREKCLAAGMNDYLAKPVRSEVLKKKLDTYVSPQASNASSPDGVRNHTTSPSYFTADLIGAATNFSLPIRDNPAYSRPTGSSTAPSQASTDTRSTIDIGSLSETQSQAASQKRSSRKLTKTRNSIDPASAEKPRAVLTKKPPQRQGTGSSMDADGKSENQPFYPNNRSSISSQGSGSRDKTFPS
ncbi:Two-component system protein A [Colletotrichum fructicola Nara gc5]|uniref:histidine kinase n=1 Tax=Colletotrichum fructicola (strain Nara gc5) TaxID=1213859 RepID=A0A7J6J1L4_COLFN|nr:Two-component system protein A [Colletotrichum fructicola Nara gc5]